MGLLDDLLGGMLGGAGQPETDPRRSDASPQGSGGMGQIMTALLPVVLAMLSNRGSGSRGGSGGGLGDILGQVLGGGTQARGGAASGGMGGLGELLEQMQRSGFGDQARSWVGKGDNMPISPDALDQIFGRGGIEEIARRTGLSEQQASSGLSQLLPEVVDRVTPSGEVPDLDQLSLSVENMRRRMGG